MLACALSVLQISPVAVFYFEWGLKQLGTYASLLPTTVPTMAAWSTARVAEALSLTSLGEERADALARFLFRRLGNHDQLSDWAAGSGTVRSASVWSSDSLAELAQYPSCSSYCKFPFILDRNFGIVNSSSRAELLYRFMNEHSAYQQTTRPHERRCPLLNTNYVEARTRQLLRVANASEAGRKLVGSLLSRDALVRGYTTRSATFLRLDSAVDPTKVNLMMGAAKATFVDRLGLSESLFRTALREDAFLPLMFNDTQLANDTLDTVVEVTFRSAENMSKELRALLEKDLLWLVLSAPLLVLCLLAFLRSPLLSFLAVVQIFAAAPLALLVYMSLGLRWMSSVCVCSLFLTIGIGADDIFMIHAAYVAHAHVPLLGVRLEAAIRRAAPAIALACVTNLLAFSALAFSVSITLSSFGILAAASILVDGLLSLVWWPALLALHDKLCGGHNRATGRNLTPACNKPSTIGRVFSFPARRAPRSAIVGSFLLCTGLAYPAASLRATEYDEELLPSDHHFVRDLGERSPYMADTFYNEPGSVVFGLKGLDSSRFDRWRKQTPMRTQFDSGFELSSRQAQASLLAFVRGLQGLENGNSTAVCTDCEGCCNSKVQASPVVLYVCHVVRLRCCALRCALLCAADLRLPCLARAFDVCQLLIEPASVRCFLRSWADELGGDDRLPSGPDFVPQLRAWLRSSPGASTVATTAGFVNDELRYARVDFDSSATRRLYGRSPVSLDGYRRLERRWQRFLDEDSALRAAPASLRRSAFALIYGRAGTSFEDASVANKTITAGIVGNGGSAGDVAESRPPLPFFSLFAMAAGHPLLVHSMYLSVAVSCLMCGLLSTLVWRNAPLGLLAALSSGAVLISFLGIIWLLGWELGLSEILVATLVCGFSIDYTVHLGFAYRSCAREATRGEGCQDRVQIVGKAADQMSSAIAGSALTTSSTVAFLGFCAMKGFDRLGLALVSVCSLSVLYAYCLFLPAISLYEALRMSPRALCCVEPS